MLAEPQPDSWKSQPYVWMLILIPLSAVIVGIIMLTLAIESETGLVVDDYYKKGKQINRVLARDQAAATMGLSAAINLDKDTNTIRIQLTANSNLITNEEIRLGLYHSTRAGMDQNLVMKPADIRVFEAEYAELAKGRWHLQLETQTWRLTGSLYVPGSDSLQLSAMPTN